ncbi:hypothetical protein OHB00_09060 [Streptomyces sp. NBC_00631]|uniref:hypothetical protein n=1 Tax=Streptomyces sp. NBC_00631 TaxID=2975793 RepID=UPI0030E331E2
MLVRDDMYELARRLGPRTVPAVHCGDHTVMRSPLAAFLAEADALGLGDRLVRCRHGEHAGSPPAIA